MTGKRKIRKWLVTTRVTSERTYEVDGLDEKEAEANSVTASPTLDEDINEETMSVVELP